MNMPVAAPEMPVGPTMEAAPPDARAENLEELLQKVDALIWRDGGIDEHEMRVIGAFYQMQQDKILAMQQQAAQAAPGDPAMAGNEEMDYTNGGDADREDEYR